MSEKSDAFSIYQFCQFESIEGKLMKTDVAFEKRCRRWYANQLGISYKSTFELAWPDIVAHYYDNQIEETPFNIVFNMAIDEYVPEMAEEEERLNEEFAKSLVEEQRETLVKQKSKVTNFSKEVNDKANKLIEKVAPSKNKEINMSFKDEGDPDEEANKYEEKYDRSK